MRPRSRLLAKRCLPTIREGYEELVQDMNQANSRHLPPHGQAHSLSTHDYFLSICQLARPTFPQGEPDYDILTVGALASLRLHRLSDRVPPCQPLISKVSRHTQSEQEESQNKCSGPERVVDVSSRQTSSRVVPSVSDPLEFLYGHREGLLSAACRSHDSQGWMGEGSQSATQRRPRPPVCAGSFPRMCSSPVTQRKSSCPELCLMDPTDQKKPNPDPAPPQTSSSDQQKPGASSSFSWTFQNDPDRAPAVTVLSHRCNFRTDSGEANVESHASSKTQPRQAAQAIIIGGVVRAGPRRLWSDRNFLPSPTKRATGVSYADLH